MKKALITATAFALLAGTAPVAKAGDRGWSTTGKVLTGVGAGLLLARAFEPPPVYVVQAPQVVYSAPPPVVVQQPAPQQVYVQQPAQSIAQPAPQPVYVQPAPVYVQPAPVVYYQPAPVYYAPAPVYYYRPAPYCYGPRVGVHFSFGRHW